MARGGAEKVVSILANSYASCGWAVSVVLLLRNDVGYALDPSIEIIDLSCGARSRLTSLPMWIAGLRKVLKSKKPDAVVSFAARINVIALVSSVGLGCPVVVSERNDPSRDGRGMTTRIATELLYPIAKKVVFQTRRARAAFSDRVGKNSVIIANPVNVQCLRNEANINRKIVTLGRLTAQKNQKMLIDAFSLISKRFPDYSLYIYGEGELEGALRQQINDLSLSGSVELMGNVPEVHKCISDAQIFVLPSDYEGMSNALLEALAMGFPCVSTNCAGSDEIIVDGWNGLLVPVGDTAELANAILRIIRSKALESDLSKHALRSSEAFESSVIVSKWKEIIEA